MKDNSEVEKSMVEVYHSLHQFLNLTEHEATFFFSCVLMAYALLNFFIIQQVNTTSAMGTYTRGSSIVEKCMAKVLIYGEMVLYMKASGVTT